MGLVTTLGALALVAAVSGQASAQTFTSLLSFSGTGGAYPGDEPLGDLTLSGTTLYGMTSSGGSNGYGNVFSIGTNGGGFQNLLTFNGVVGADPQGSLTLSGTTLYGMAAQGGSSNNGTIFSVGTNGSGFRQLLSFSGTAGAYPGKNPHSSLTLSGTRLYGTTEDGDGSGNVFSVGTNGSGYQNLLMFFVTNGWAPSCSLALSGTTLYGTTAAGGSSNNGTIFSVGTNGSGFRQLLSFSGTAGAYPGSLPNGSLTLSGTTLYGMTSGQTRVTNGNIFCVGIDGSGYQNLLTFTGAGGAYPGENPYGSLTLIGTTLYGMTCYGGGSGTGNVFSVGTNGSGYQNLLSFGGAYPGACPNGSLTANSAATIGLAAAINATIISGGTAALCATVTNSATSSTLYGMTQSGGSSNDGTMFSLTVPGANILNYELSATVQSGIATLGAITSGTGSLAPSASQSSTVSATSTHLGVNSIALTASDPNSSNLSQTTTATLTVLDHAAAAFAKGSTTLDLSFGTLHVGSGTQALQFQIENLPAAYRAGLDLDSVMVLSDPESVFSTDAAAFTDLAQGTMSNLFDLFLNTSQVGEFSGQYQFNLSDEKDLSGHAGQQTLTLNVTAEVVPEPSTLVLLLTSALGLAGFAWRRRRATKGRIVALCSRRNIRPHPASRVLRRPQLGRFDGMRDFFRFLAGLIVLLATGVVQAQGWQPEWSSRTLSQARYVLAAAAAGNDVLFAGGYASGFTTSNVVNIYSTSTGSWSTATLSQPRGSLAAAAAGNEVFFAGGYTIAPSNVVNIFNTSTGSWSTATLSQPRYNMAAAAAGNDVVFAGGYTGSSGPSSSSVADVYDTSTNTWFTAALSQPRAVWRPRPRATTSSSPEGGTTPTAPSAPAARWTFSTTARMPGRWRHCRNRAPTWRPPPRATRSSLPAAARAPAAP